MFQRTAYAVPASLQREQTPPYLSARPATRVVVRQLNSRDLQWLPALSDLLIDGVHQGATLGFIAPLSRYAALDYWHGVFARLGSNQSLWIACQTNEAGEDGPLQGAVQLSLCPRANAHHRGEVQRLRGPGGGFDGFAGVLVGTTRGCGNGARQRLEGCNGGGR